MDYSKLTDITLLAFTREQLGAGARCQSCTLDCNFFVVGRAYVVRLKDGPLAGLLPDGLLCSRASSGKGTGTEPTHGESHYDVHLPCAV